MLTTFDPSSIRIVDWDGSNPQIYTGQYERQLQCLAQIFEEPNWIYNVERGLTSFGMESEAKSLSVSCSFVQGTLYWLDVCGDISCSPPHFSLTKWHGDEGEWQIFPVANYRETLLAARVLHSLNFDNQDTLSVLDLYLSRHEQLELRLALPRGFLPANNVSP